MLGLHFPRREVIGAPDCPLIYRWTLWGSDATGKIMLHRFLPNTTDPDVHDHPWAFVTFVLRGSYDDMVLCSACRGTGWEHRAEYIGRTTCRSCMGDCVRLGERMRAGMVRYRDCQHCHRTRTHEEGAWTLVITGRKVREWGFWRNGEWWGFRAYERAFGFVMRCTDRETTPR